MQERIKQSEQKIKKLSEDLRKQLLFMNMMEKPTKSAKDKLYKIEGLLSAEVCELVRLSYEIALIYEEMITSTDLAMRLEAQKLKSYLSADLSSGCHEKSQEFSSIQHRRKNNRFFE
ncbi:hypothetical protein V9K30_003618 [Vibrio cholerae]|uniref:hypothetical protein n=1 Tax=Vibrio cholerae TaxID=666 RepID=UPI0011DA6484|nr:hypothetical protein [Vibrio cholerae]EIN5953659.1 hypothetical protein [Vibrio cholerae]EIV0337007.1 hypothetical protein [Vibrio cholerae]MDV2308144.1 hypothetical protein [Vibrio cholerae]TXX55093.1 hypothetical protein FXF07_05980 [Vibrio cholerae]GIB88574.1 hypothetical protein VCSRO142_3269 [Vibrio cholerae]